MCLQHGEPCSCSASSPLKTREKPWERTLHATFLKQAVRRAILRGQSEGVSGACFLLLCFWHMTSCKKSTSTALLMQTLLTPFALVSAVLAYRHCILLSPEHLLEHVFSCGQLSLSYFTGSEVRMGRACFSVDCHLQGTWGCPSQEGQLKGC